MAFNIESTLKTIRDYIVDNHRAHNVVIGRRLSLPTEELSASIIMDSVTVADTTLDKTIEQHVVTIRLYHRTIGPHEEDAELALAKQAELIMEDLIGEYDLGGSIRSVDVGGIYGTSPSVFFNTIEDTQYHVADITIPLIVDDSIAHTP